MAGGGGGSEVGGVGQMVESRARSGTFSWCDHGRDSLEWVCLSQESLELFPVNSGFSSHPHNQFAGSFWINGLLFAKTVIIGVKSLRVVKQRPVYPTDQQTDRRPVKMSELTGPRGLEHSPLPLFL